MRVYKLCTLRAIGLGMKHNWTIDTVAALFELPLFELVSQSYAVLKQNFDPADIEFCKLSNIKSGACPEDCAYCSQSGHYHTGLKREKLAPLAQVLKEAKEAKAQGAKRFCMGAAWRTPPAKDMPAVLEMIKSVKALGLETCATLGMLDEDQSLALKEAGLDYYNHNLDTSPDYYEKIITTRSYQDRLQTLKHIHDAGIHICCGGILGMGETQQDRIAMLLELKKLPQEPKSIPINKLIAIPGTPLSEAKAMDPFEFIKTIAVTRILFPRSRIRLSAGRATFSPEMQAWCFMAGANSIWIGDQLLTVPNTDKKNDESLLKSLSLKSPDHTSYAI